MDRLKIISEALHEAEGRLIRYQERHDHILDHMCSNYLINQNMQEALAGARDAMNEALELVVALRKLQLQAIVSFS